MNPDTSPQAQGAQIVPKAAQAAPRTIDTFLQSLRKPLYVIKYGLKSENDYPITFTSSNKTLEWCTRRKAELDVEYQTHKFRIEEYDAN